MHEVQLAPNRPTRYESPATIEAVLELLATYGVRARVIAGGTDLLLELDRRAREVDVLVDLTRIEGLDAVVWANGRIHLGPLVTHNQVATSDLVQTHGLPLAQACLEVGSPALRNRATVVGNVVTASPANDSISALAALDATVSIASVRGIRTVALAEFHTGVRQTVLEPDELVTGISFPTLPETAAGVYVKLGLRRAQAISVVHAAVVVDRDADGAVTDARIALGSVAPTIVRLPEVEAGLVGGPLTETAIEAAASAAQAAVTPIDDLRAPATYRHDLVAVLVRRALAALAADEERAAFPTGPIPTLGGPIVEADGVAAGLAAGDSITATINGEAVTAGWNPGTLLDWVRNDVGLTGTKEGCAEGECGACSVTLDGVTVLSCLVPAGRAQGATLVTIEGLAGGELHAPSLHPMQQSFVEHAAVQCGYCIPGYVMAASALAKECPAPTDTQARLGLAGNLCRCTGYYAIRAAVSNVAGGRS